MPSNPVVNRFADGSVPNQGPAGPAPAPTPEQLQQMYGPTYQGPPPNYPTGYGQQPPGYPPGYGQPQAYAAPTPTRYMTLDDVVVRTAAMLGMLIVTGAFSWALATSSAALPLLFIGLLGGLGMGLYIAFTGKANVVTSLVYAGFEGLFLGAISRAFNEAWPGIVVQAVTGTVAVAVGMLFVYRIGAIRVTPRFTRIVVGATIGALGLMLVNLVVTLFHPGGLGLRSGGGLAIAFSLVVIVIAAMNLVLDFDMIEQGIRRGADEKFAWYASFGLMVTLVWLYLEILRLLSYFRD